MRKWFSVPLFPATTTRPPAEHGTRAHTTMPHLSLALENTGSVARDHLASERT